VTTIHSERFADLDTTTLYALLKLRADVFVVEQHAPYQDLDGRDDEPGTRHLWVGTPDNQSRPLAYARLLTEPDGTMRIGRVVTAPEARGRGLARRLVEVAIQADPDAVTVLDAQSHLVGFYRKLGFQPCGDEYIEDGIPHVPMRRPAPARAGR
jgi:ElaA protein